MNMTRRATMTAGEYRRALAMFGITQHDDAGEWLGVSPQTSKNWSLGADNTGRSVPGHVAKLFRLMLKLNLKPEDVK